MIRGKSAAQDYPYEIPKHSFIRYDLNRLQFYGDSNALNPLFRKIDSLLFTGLGQIRIVHIGGSHIQADIFSDRMRQRLSDFFPGNPGGRGFIFPYQMANTNNPYNYVTNHTGTWHSCRNTQKTRDCALGLSGMSVTTRDTASSVKVSFRGTASEYEFTKVRIFHEPDGHSFSIRPVLPDSSPVIRIDKATGFTQFTFSKPTTEFKIKIQKTDSLQDHFTLYGFDFTSDEPGFTYNATGVNGADVPSWVRCTKFVQHLKALRPDLVILSIGINDAISADFNAAAFESNYDTLIGMIRKASPKTSILFTTNNDSYNRSRIVNKNVIKVVERMQNLSRKYNAAVWNLFEVMGGLNSILHWQRKGLAKRDRIHFTTDGYKLIGDLFFNAFMASFDKYLVKMAALKRK